MTKMKMTRMADKQPPIKKDVLFHVSNAFFQGFIDDLGRVIASNIGEDASVCFEYVGEQDDLTDILWCALPKIEEDI